MSALLGALNSLGPAWGTLLVFSWVLFQLYNPFWETKIQRWHRDLTVRLQRIEVTLVAVSEEVDGMDSEEVRRIHDQEKLSTTDLKTERGG